MLQTSPDFLAVIGLSILLLLFAMLVAFVLHIAAPDKRELEYEKVWKIREQNSWKMWMEINQSQ